jgi:hypothetical protein
MTDYMSALRNYLLGQAAVTALCGLAIYVLALPQEELDMADPLTGLPIGAHKVIVLLASGGQLGKMRNLITEARVDVVCFGETDFDAATLERAAADAIKNLRRAMVGTVFLHGATVASGPLQTRDPVTFWPCMRRQIILRADEREVGSYYATV